MTSTCFELSKHYSHLKVRADNTGANAPPTRSTPKAPPNPTITQDPLSYHAIIKSLTPQLAWVDP